MHAVLLLAEHVSVHLLLLAAEATLEVIVVRALAAIFVATAAASHLTVRVSLLADVLTYLQTRCSLGLHAADLGAALPALVHEQLSVSHVHLAAASEAWALRRGQVLLLLWQLGWCGLLALDRNVAAGATATAAEKARTVVVLLVGKLSRRQLHVPRALLRLHHHGILINLIIKAACCTVVGVVLRTWTSSRCIIVPVHIVCCLVSFTLNQLNFDFKL